MRNLRIAALAAAALAAIAAAPATTAAASSSVPSAPSTASSSSTHAKPLHPSADKTTDRKSGGVGQLSLQTNGKTGVVSPTPKVYLVFWGSQWSKDPAKVAPDMQSLFKGLYGASDTWGTILTQYCENAPAGTTKCPSTATFVTHPTSSILAGVWFDNAAAAAGQRDPGPDRRRGQEGRRALRQHDSDPEPQRAVRHPVRHRHPPRRLPRTAASAPGTTSPAPPTASSPTPTCPTSPTSAPARAPR